MTSRPVLPGATFKIVEIQGSTITTDKGDRFELVLPNDHVSAKHSDPRIGDRATVTSAHNVLDVGTPILVEILGTAPNRPIVTAPPRCLCRNIVLRVVSLGAS